MASAKWGRAAPKQMLCSQSLTSQETTLTAAGFGIGVSR